MKKMTNRTKQAIASKKKIYECGIKLMREFGYDSITVEQIANEAEVSVGTFYHYFKSKSDLLVEIFKQGDEYFKLSVPKLMKQYNSCFDRIIEYFVLYAQLAINEGVEKSINIYIPTNKLFLTAGRAMQDMLIVILRKGQESGEIPKSIDCSYLTKNLFVAARGVVFDWCLHDGKTDIIADMKDMIERLARSYLSYTYQASNLKNKV